MLRWPPFEVLWTLAGVFALLVASSLLVSILKRARPEKDFTELAARVRTWWVISGLFSIALFGTGSLAIGFFAFVSSLALWEFFSLIPTRKADRRVLIWAYVAIPVQYCWVYQQWYGMFIIFIPVYMFLLLPTRAVMVGETDGFIRSISTVHWGLMTTVFSLSHAAFLLILRPDESVRLEPSWPSEQGKDVPGAGLLVLLVLLTQFNDVAQFVWGKALGKTRVVPKVSPGKTLAGLFGGVATTVVLAGVVGPLLTLMDWQRSLIAGLIIGLSGFAGDLSISALKRDLGVKDSGSILPGHGGILDRVDSLTYTAPLFFHYVYYLYF